MTIFGQCHNVLNNKILIFVVLSEVTLTFFLGHDNLRASKPCEADVRGTQVSLKNTPVSLSSTQVSFSSSPFSLMVSIYVGGCLCLASLACLACMARMARTSALHALHVWLAWHAGSHIGHTPFLHTLIVLQQGIHQSSMGFEGRVTLWVWSQISRKIHTICISS